MDFELDKGEVALDGGTAMTSFPAPIRPLPTTGEALAGYVARVMLSNGYLLPLPWASWFPKRRSIHVSMALLGIDPATVESLLGVLPTRQRITGTWALAPSDLNGQWLRWCPCCLAADGIQRGSWGLKLFAVCPVHRVMLIDRCPTCSQPVSFKRVGAERCACGCKLTDALVIEAADSAVWLARCLERALCNQSFDNPAPFAALCLADWLRLIRYLGPFAANTRPDRPGQLADGHDMAVAGAIVIDSSVLLADWPTGFDALLLRILREQPDASGLQQGFGRIYRVLYQDLAGEQFDFLRQAFEHFLGEHWWGLLGSRNRRLRTGIRSRGASRNAVCQTTGVTPRQLDWLIEQGQVSARHFRYKSGRCLVSVAMDEVVKVAEYVDNWLDLQAAAKLTGLARHRVRELIEAGVVLAKRTGIRSAWLIDGETLDEIAVACSHHASGQSQMLVSLAVVLKHWRFPHGAFVSLIQALMTGQLQTPSQTQPGRLADLLLDVGAVRAWLTHWRNDGFSIDEAARQLGIKQQVAYQLVRAGLLVASDDRLGKRISGDALWDFQARYVGLAELSRQLRCAPKVLLANLGVQPVCGPRIDGTRQYFFLRSKVAGVGC